MRVVNNTLHTVVAYNSGSRQEAARSLLIPLKIDISAGTQSSRQVNCKHAQNLHHYREVDLRTPRKRNRTAEIGGCGTVTVTALYMTHL